MTKTLLDTDIISEYFKGRNSRVANHAASYAEEFGIFTFTSVTVHEIVYGLELKGAFAQLQKALSGLDRTRKLHQLKQTTLRRLPLRPLQEGGDSYWNFRIV